jgi:hypothetical protein
MSNNQIDFPRGKLPPHVTYPSLVRSYVARIGDSWRRAAEGMMEVARLCFEASEQLTVSDKRQLIQQLPFEEPAFSKFVQIGKDARLHALHARGLLPPHYTIAYLLTRLTDEQLKTAVSHKVIKPDMTRAELQDWLKAGRGWLQPDRPDIRDRRGAGVVAAQDEDAFATLAAAWSAAPDLQTAWTNATDAARERFVREVLRVSAVRRRRSQVQ